MPIIVDMIKRLQNKTSIAVERSTRNRLAKLGQKDEIFDDILKKLLPKEVRKNE